MRFPTWINSKFLIQLLLLVVGMVLATSLGFKGACQQFFERKKPAQSAVKPAVNLLNNAYLQVKSNSPYTVVFFLSKECPMCKNYRPLIKKLNEQYGSTGLIDMLVLRTDADKKQDSSYFLPDEYAAGKAAVEIATYFGASVTPEVFVLDSSNNILYKGAIDNWSYETGKHSPAATEHYLKNVLSKIASGEKVSYSEEKAFGCYIE